MLSDDELTLWHNNPKRITLGHVRAIAKLSQSKRERLLRGLLAKKTPVRQFEQLAKGEEVNQGTDIKRYELLMGEALGRPIKIQYNASKRTGTVTLRFFNLDDLDVISKAQGFDYGSHL